MSLQVRDNIGIAVDGGGIRGMIVAHGLAELERQLGVERLLDDPRIKVVAGTSTGAILAAMIAAGFRASEMIDIYRNLGPKVFSEPGRLRPFGKNISWLSKAPVPHWFFRIVEKSYFLKYALFPARYSNKPLREEIIRRQRAQAQAGLLPSENPTMEELGRFLAEKNRDLTLVITAVDVISRRTLFIKSSLPEEESAELERQGRVSKRYLQRFQLADAILASSTIPTYWDPVEIDDVPDKEGNPRKGYLVDGGVGSFGNPAGLVAWELCNNHRRHDIPALRANERYNPYDPGSVTLFSFGTGNLSDDFYRSQHGTPNRWWALDWATGAIDMFMGDANREQTRGILQMYPGIDLRRFQVELPEVIEADDVADDKLAVLENLGTEVLAQHIRENRHALQADDELRYDPERIWNKDMVRLMDPFACVKLD